MKALLVLILVLGCCYCVDWDDEKAWMSFNGGVQVVAVELSTNKTGMPAIEAYAPGHGRAFCVALQPVDKLSSYFDFKKWDEDDFWILFQFSNEGRKGFCACNFATTIFSHAGIFCFLLSSVILVWLWRIPIIKEIFGNLRGIQKDIAKDDKRQRQLSVLERLETEENRVKLSDTLCSGKRDDGESREREGLFASLINRAHDREEEDEKEKDDILHIPSAKGAFRKRGRPRQSNLGSADA